MVNVKAKTEAKASVKYEFEGKQATCGFALHLLRFGVLFFVLVLALLFSLGIRQASRQGRPLCIFRLLIEAVTLQEKVRGAKGLLREARTQFLMG